jgi:hypothetical protein
MHICGCRFVFVSEIATYLYVRIMKVEEVALDILLIVCSYLSYTDLLNLRLTSVFFKRLVDCTPKLGFTLRLYINGGEPDDSCMELYRAFGFSFFFNEEELRSLDSFWLRHLAIIEVITNEGDDDTVARNDRFGRFMRFLESRRATISRIKVILSLNYRRVTKFNSQKFFRRVNESPLDLILEVHGVSKGVRFPFLLLSETSFTLFFNLKLRWLDGLGFRLLEEFEYPLSEGLESPLSEDLGSPSLEISVSPEGLESPSFYATCPRKVINIDTNSGVLQGRNFRGILENWGPSQLIKFSPSWLDFSDIPDWNPTFFWPSCF